MIMSKKWLLGACGALLAGGLFASTANASLFVEVQATHIKDPGAASFVTLDAWNTLHNLTGAAAATGKSVPLLAAGQTVQLDIWMSITGADGDPSDDGLNTVIGNMQSYITGNNKAAGVGAFAANGAEQKQGDNTFITTVGLANYGKPPSNGAIGAPKFLTQNLGPTALYPFALDDGSPDFGNVPGDASNGRIVISAGGQNVLNYAADKGNNPYVKGAPKGNGKVYVGSDGIRDIIGSVTWTPSSLDPAGGTTEINFLPWEGPNGKTFYQAAFWAEDDTGGAYTMNASQGSFSFGGPVTLTAAVIPEPASLSLLGLGALGLLARRRK